MVSVHAYYDGHGYVTEGNVAVKPNQRVIITFLDETEPPSRNLKRFVGKVSNAESDLVAQTVEKSDMSFFDGLNGSWNDGISPEDEAAAIRAARTQGTPRVLEDF